MPQFIIEAWNDLRLFGAPAALTKAIKNDLTIANPLFENAVLHGRRTHGIPQKIRVYEEYSDHLSIPRGYLSKLVDTLPLWGIEYLYKNLTTTFDPIFPPKKITTWDYQAPWITALLSEEQGMGQAPPGSGKTIMGLEVYARLGQPCLWLTHTGRLARQARKRAETFLGIETGFIGQGGEDIKHFTVGMVQTLIRRDLSEYKDKFGLILVDECHHLPAETFTKVVSAFSARYRYGLTATPYRDDGLQDLMFHALGPKLASIGKQELRVRGKLMTPTVVRRPTKFSFPYDRTRKKQNYKALDDALASNHARNKQIATDVLVETCVKDNNVCIVLVGRLPHGQALYDLLSPVIPGTGYVHSKMTAKKSDAILDAFESGEYRILIATYKMLAEGFDYPPANRLFLTGPYKGRTRIEQACGRIERVYPGKDTAFIYDYVDSEVGVLNRQAEVRLDVYEANDMPVITVDRPYET